MGVCQNIVSCLFWQRAGYPGRVLYFAHVVTIKIKIICTYYGTAVVVSTCGHMVAEVHGKHTYEWNNLFYFDKTVVTWGFNCY